MAKKIANSTCTKCHGIFPRTEMKQVTVQENSGSSFGISANPSSKVKNSTRLSARNYTRNKKVWVCNDCVKLSGGAISNFIKNIVVISLLLGFFYICYGIVLS